MATFRSNLNSVSNTYSLNGLQNLKNRITTCFQNWRCKTLAKQQKYQQQQQQHQQQYFQQQRQQYFEFSFREYSLIEKTSQNLQNFNNKIKKLLPLSRKKCRKVSKNPKAPKRQKVEIVAKLLSSTLLGTAVGANSTEVKYQAFENSSMTITYDSILELRDEYPDLDVEVRSILMARAQNGATISDIKEDYLKNTGIKFPLDNNITEFLLSIPYVSAMCSERGTRIFNILPNDKTKHIHHMVMEQKPPQPQIRRAFSHRDGQPRRLLPFEVLKSRRQLWRTNNYNKYRDLNNFNSNVLTPRIVPIESHHGVLQRSVELMDIDGQNSQSDSEEFVEQNNYYKDNCNYFKNRFYHRENLAKLNNNNKQLQHNYNNNNHTPLNAIIHSNNNKDYNYYHYNNNFNNLNAHNIKPFSDLHSLAARDNQPNAQQQQKPQFIQPHNVSFRSVTTNRCNLKRKLPVFSPAYTKSSQSNESDNYNSEKDYEAHLLDFPLLGDDFFLYMARMELKCKFKKGEQILQSGLCISGQTISEATRRVHNLPDGNKRFIINIGSVDIMQGRPLLEIEHDYRELINVVHHKGMIPILTTLGPLANYIHNAEIRKIVMRFNEFIKREGRYLTVIDLWSCLTNDKGQTLFDCFQEVPRKVTGAPEFYVFWNKIGRQRVLQLIKSQLEY